MILDLILRITGGIVFLIGGLGVIAILGTCICDYFFRRLKAAGNLVVLYRAASIIERKNRLMDESPGNNF